MDKPGDLSDEAACEENMISSTEIMEGDICIDCGFRCIQGCV